MDEEDTFSILVASDIHLGYGEKNAELGKDSFVSFEEILKIGKERDVDFILLGGDLFHENRPSRKTLHSTFELFKKYCMGSRPCQFEVVSDQAVNFGHTSSTVTEVNYENENINVSIPVFSIHGNHDDPCGSGTLSAIDLLSVTGYLNHFGKQTSLEKITVSPVLLKKGRSKLALYGLGSMQDERLHRLFLKKHVTMMRPEESMDDWFNIMVIHQNRTKHGRTNYIPESFLDDFLDLVVWGHEHECLIEPTWSASRNFMVMQPGSPVATSLCQAECVPKKVAIVRVRGREMETEVIPLKTVRQFYFETVQLSNKFNANTHPIEEKRREAVMTYLKEKVEGVLSRSVGERSGHPKQPHKPLIRLRVECSNEFRINAYRFGANFQDRVANPHKIIHLMKNRGEGNASRKVVDPNVREMDDMMSKEVIEQQIKVEDFVHQFYNEAEDQKDQLGLLKAKSLSFAIGEIVKKQEKEAIHKSTEHQVDKILKNLNLQEFELNMDTVRDKIFEVKSKLKAEEPENDANELKELQQILARNRNNKKSRKTAANDEISLENVAPPKAKRGRGRGRGGSTRGSTTRGRGKKKQEVTRSSQLLTSYFSQSQLPAKTATVKTAPPSRKKNEEKMSQNFLPDSSKFHVSESSDDDVVMTSQKSQVTSSQRSVASSQRSLRVGRKQNFKFSSSSEEDDDNPFQRRRK